MSYKVSQGVLLKNIKNHEGGPIVSKIKDIASKMLKEIWWYKNNHNIEKYLEVF